MLSCVFLQNPSQTQTEKSLYGNGAAPFRRRFFSPSCMNPTNTDNPRKRPVCRSSVAFSLLLLLAGCQTYEAQSQGLAQANKSGSLASAVVQADKQAQAGVGSKDELLYRLEQGSALRSAAQAEPSLLPDIRSPLPTSKNGESAPAPLPAPTAAEVHSYYLKRSVAAFDAAEEKVNAWENEAKVKLGAEAGALFTNQANLPYRGRAYDKVMMNAYKALDYMALGEKDNARVELNRSLQRQRDAVEANEKRIAAVQEQADLARQGQLKDEKGQAVAYDSSRAVSDNRTGPALQATFNASIASMRPYGDYVNPFAVFLDGLFFTVLGEGGSDFEHGRKSFERLVSMVPENRYLQADLFAATNAAEGKALTGVTYVIFETGSAPSRTQVRVDIPTFVVTSKLAYVGAAFPKLVFDNNYINILMVTAGETTCTTSTIASMDSVVANDFKNAWPSVVTKTLITTATKAILQAAIQKQLDDRGGWAGLIGTVAMTAFNAGTNIADTRTWRSLPKEFQYARVPTPENRELTITVGAEHKTVVLDPGLVHVVYVKSTSPTAPLFVSSFVLK